MGWRFLRAESGIRSPVATARWAVAAASPQVGGNLDFRPLGAKMQPNISTRHIAAVGEKNDLFGSFFVVSSGL